MRTQEQTTTRTPRQIQVPNQRAFEITFGVEIECFLPRGSVRAGGYHNGIELGGRFPRGWNAQKDGSLNTTLRSYEGVEIVSPILKGIDGLQQVKLVADLLNEMGAKVNKSCGFHVHVGVTSIAGHDYNEVADFVRRLLKLTAQHEMAFYGAAGTTNRYNGTYCRSLSQGSWSSRKNKLAKKKLTADELRFELSGIDRRQLLNIQPVFDSKKTVEFRVFSGTTNPIKMAAYIQMALAAASRAMDNDTGFDSIKTAKDYYKPECKVEGWLDEIDNLKIVKQELMRLAKQFDSQHAN